MEKERKPASKLFYLLWDRILATPVAIKIIGLVLMPVVVVVMILAAWLHLEFNIFAPLRENDNATLSLESLYNLILHGLVMVGAGTLIGLVISFLLTWLIVRQLSTLVNAMQQVQNGDLTVRSNVWAQDEIGEVQAAFNTMVDGLEQSRVSLMKTQKNLERLNAENNLLLAELTKKEAEMRHALRRAVEYQEEERKRISRELHDEIGQALTSILIRLKNLQDVTDPDLISDRVNGIRYIASQTIEEMRRLSMDLRPAVLDNLGIVPALRWYVGQVAQQNEGIEIQFHSPERMERMPPEVEIVLYRIAQEGLNNATRHGRAQHIAIKLERTPRFVWLGISDNGRGFDPARSNRGLGLVGIRERVELLNGQCQIESQAGSGTRLWVEIPLDKKESAHA
jgi:signal transduction histidine kinase